MKHLFLFALCCTAMFAAAQKKTLKAVKPLTVGDTVPDFTFKQVLNYPSSTAKLSDFKGKLVILDMWSTYCGSCIDAFPKMQALQDKFKNRIQVLLVNPYPAADDPDARIKQVLTRVKQRTGLTLTMPIPLHDTMLNHLFPHQTVPHVVVINEKGVLISATYTWALTPENVQSILAGNTIHLPVKNDWGFDKNTPLFVNGNCGDGSDFIYRSILTSYKDGVPAYMGTAPGEDGKTTRLYVINYPLFTMFQLAYPDVFKYPANRTYIETNDTVKFTLHHNEEEDNRNSYCYEVIAPADVAVLKEYMQQDLERTFNVVAVNEERTIKCYALKKISNTGAVISLGDSSGMDVEKTTLNKYIHNKPIAAFIEVLNYILPVPVTDDTGIPGNISFDFPFNIWDYDMQQWNGFLANYGLELQEIHKKMEVTVIINKQ
ncbi:MAG TPA: redoxin domain-containing protein [Parafilimonas sp.]|nr:redoxin domain-containing protein [Parafilimonas sp.]